MVGQAGEETMDLSLIVPCYNEAANLPTFFASATACFDATEYDYELVFVNDGSSDETMSVLSRAVESYRARGGRATVRILEFSRNFGKEAAMFAGLEQAAGDTIGFIDADMQQDPAVALRMYRCLIERPDYDCVAAVQEKRRESLPLRACKRVFYHAFNDVCNTQLLEGVSDFRVFRRPVAEALLSMREHYRFSKGLFAWVGFKTYVISYDVHERLSGASKWRVRDLVSYAWNGVLAFFTWPLKMVMYAGVVIMLATLVFFGIDLHDKITYNNDLSTTQLLVYVVLLMGGVQMFVLGIFGEYMARAYIETKNRPLYVMRSEHLYEAREDSSDAAGRKERSHEGVVDMRQGRDGASRRRSAAVLSAVSKRAAASESAFVDSVQASKRMAKDAGVR